MSFSQIFGQREVIKWLEHSLIEDNISHAYMFCGPDGIGKKHVACLFAAVLMCMKVVNDKRCGVCEACRLYDSNTNPDLKHISPGDNGSISVDEIRILASDIIIKPVYGRHKVYIIENADCMTVQAQNCLLKTLEEPPPFTVIILTVQNTDLILETVKSRVAKYLFKKNTRTEVVEYLKERYPISDQDIDFIAAYSDGVIGNAIEMAENGDTIEVRQSTIDSMLKLKKSRPEEVFSILKFMESNKKNIDLIFYTMTMLYRDMLVYIKTRNEKILINSDKKDIIINNIAGFSESSLIRHIEEINNTRKAVRQNANFRLSIEVMLMKLQEEFI